MLARDNRFKQEEINRQANSQPAPGNLIVNAGSLEPRLPPIWQEKMHSKFDALLDLYDRNHKR